ncbi:MAG TPA: Flp family type IVb pilin [Hyphomicrobiaceae bacterium]|nr:Flp family type IVb pilin [Hyphomicrobiaceae bacterium]
MRGKLHNLLRNDSGATAIEYSLIAALIGLALVAVLVQVGIELKGPFQEVQTGLQQR